MLKIYINLYRKSIKKSYKFIGITIIEIFQLAYL